MVPKRRLIKMIGILLASVVNILKILGPFCTVTCEMKGQTSNIFSESLPLFSRLRLKSPEIIIPF